MELNVTLTTTLCHGKIVGASDQTKDLNYKASMLPTVQRSLLDWNAKLRLNHMDISRIFK